MCACDGVGALHAQDRTSELVSLLWVEEDVVIPGAVELAGRPQVVLFAEEWQLTLAQAAALASLPSPRLDG